MTVDVALSTIVNGDDLLNGSWIDGKSTPACSIPSVPYLGIYGHYRYSVSMVDAAQIGSYLDFWEGLASGSGGGAGLVATSGGGQSASGPGTFPLDFSDATNGRLSFITPSGRMNAFKYACASFMNSTCVGCVFTGNFNGATWKNATITNASFSGNLRAATSPTRARRRRNVFWNLHQLQPPMPLISLPAGTTTAIGCSFTGSSFKSLSP